MAEIRRILTREDIEKKDRRNKTIIGVVLAVIMLLSTAGYAFFGNPNSENEGKKANYNGYEFLQQGDFWMMQTAGKTFYFSYLPNETRDFSVKKELVSYVGKPLYFIKNGAGEQEIMRNLGNFAERIQLACMEEENCTDNLPVKNCTSNMIVMREQEVNNLAEEENCMFIISNESVRDADAFLYKLLGIK